MGGLLANFAAGAFLVILRPFRVGDFVTAAGVTGTVNEIGLFRHDDQHPRQHSHHRRQQQDLLGHVPEFLGQQLPARGPDGDHQQRVDHHGAIGLLKQRLATIPNVLTTPAPDVDVLQFTPAGPLLCVRPYCSNEHYWQV